MASCSLEALVVLACGDLGLSGLGVKGLGYIGVGLRAFRGLGFKGLRVLHLTLCCIVLLHSQSSVLRAIISNPVNLYRSCSHTYEQRV